MIDIINYLNVDYLLMGNHEFDFGSDRLAELMDKSNFVWLGSNVRNSIDRSLFHTTKDIDIFTVPSACGSEFRVGIFGVCTEMTPVLADPGDKVCFESAIDHCKRCVALLQLQDVHFIIAMTHLDLNNDFHVAELDGIDVVIGGHDHKTVFQTHSSGTLVIKCGQDLDSLGILDITFLDDKRTASSWRYDFEMLPMGAVELDAVVDERISYWRTLGAASSDNGDGSGGDEVVCAVGEADENDNDDDQHSHAHSQLSLSTLTTDLRHHETAFACLIAEAVKYSYRDQGCQIGIQNGGFIRRDSTYKVGTVLRASDLREELPFPRTPVLIRMKGCDIKLALEQMIARCPAPVGSFPHLSDGWEAEYDLTQPAMQRIQAIKYLDSSISMEDSFLLAITDFYAEKGGDGVDAYMNKEVVAAHGRTVCDCALEYFKGKQTISGKLPLRFVDKSLQ